MKKFHIHAVLFKDADWRRVQCLEYDIAAQAKSIEALKAELEHTLTIHMELAAKRGREPFAAYHKPLNATSTCIIPLNESMASNMGPQSARQKAAIALSELSLPSLIIRSTALSYSGSLSF